MRAPPRLRDGEAWVRRFALGRVASALVAAALLAVHRVTEFDAELTVLGLGYGVASAVATVLVPGLIDRWQAWVIDAAVCLALVLASQDWRSPFYLMALSAAILPAARLPLAGALRWGAAFTAAYAGVAVGTGLDVATLRTTARLDTFATHLLLPLVLTAGVAYAAEGIRRLRQEQIRSQRLAVEAERRRIAWELHDSAKQRLHAASLLLSSLETDPETGALVASSLKELRGAAADMETSITDLRSPLDGRALDQALRDRVVQLAATTTAVIEVEGAAPELPPVEATHAYRILSEAISNAARHAEASRIGVRLDAANGHFHAVVEDDGRGLPEELRPGASGLLTMRSRAFAIGARLDIGRPPGGRGTRVTLDVPLEHEGEVR